MASGFPTLGGGYGTGMLKGKGKGGVNQHQYDSMKSSPSAESGSGNFSSGATQQSSMREMVSGSSTEAPSSATNLTTLEEGRKLTDAILSDLPDLSPRNRNQGMSFDRNRSGSVESMVVA